jgi:hypothetical protein
MVWAGAAAGQLPITNSSFEIIMSGTSQDQLLRTMGDLNRI